MAESTFDAELEALKTIGSYTPYIGYAIQAYGVYQELFGPVKKPIRWDKIIAASEKRIIDVVKKQAFLERLHQLKEVANFWDVSCAAFLATNPLSPETVSSFESYIGGAAALMATTREVGGLTLYFADVPQEYATFAALVTANTLYFTLLTTQETYHIAANGTKTGTKTLSNVIQKAIDVMQAWPEKYFEERASHLIIEIEEKYSGRADPFGKGRNKHPTGVRILHDSAPDPAIGSLEGLRYDHFPNKVEEVRKKYQESKLGKRILPDLLKEWRALRAKALASENSPLRLHNPTEPPRASSTVDPRTWFRLRNVASPSTSVDVVNDSTRVATDAQLQLVPEGNYSGQFWQFRPSETSPGLWNLCTLFLGKGMCLDVYGDDKTRPHLATAGGYSGQQWQLVDRNNGSWSLSNAYSGADMFLTTRSNPDGSMRLTVEAREENNKAQMWILSPIRTITEREF